MAESGQAFSLTEVSAANRGKNESRPTTRGSAVADLDIDSDQVHEASSAIHPVHLALLRI